MQQEIKVNLFTTELEYVGEYHAPEVPREGEFLSWNEKLYKVEIVSWEGLPDEPAVQVRLEHD